MTKKVEKRGSKRAPIEMWVKEEAGDYYYIHRACNISIGGLFLEKKFAANKKGISTFLFRLPISHELIVVQGKPAHDTAGKKKTSNTGTGIQFVDLPKDARKLIHKYVSLHKEAQS